MTESTLALVGERFETKALGTQDLKGISRPVMVYAVIGPAGGEAAFEAAPAALTPLIDRENELAPLLEAWRKAQDGQGVVVHVAGEAGIGKSRLVQALRERVREQAGAEHILTCSPHHSSTALHPAIRFLERTADLDRTSPPERQLDALERCAAAVALDPGETVPLLADLLAIPAGAAPRTDMLPRDARNATLRALEALLVGDATNRPLLLVVEDLHWSDPTTIELLERIVTGLASAAGRVRAHVPRRLRAAMGALAGRRRRRPRSALHRRTCGRWPPRRARWRSTRRRSREWRRRPRACRCSSRRWSS